MEGKESAGKSFLGKSFRFLRKDVAIFAFFLLLSFFFWYLNSLRKEFEIDLRYPVKYLGSPGRVSEDNLPDKLIFSIKGPGYTIIKLKLSGNRSPLTIDFSKISFRRLQESQPPEYFFVTSGLIPHFSKQLRSEFQILSVKPDTIFVTPLRRIGFPVRNASSQEEKHKN
ncbi:MAG TPA: hypothetical protein VMT63_10805 [Bacteroidales bacterium]|nr:hypothetical protein [Bacteroidales bacterium]